MSVKDLVLDLLQPLQDAAENRYCAAFPPTARKAITDERVAAVRRLVVWQALANGRKAAAAVEACDAWKPRGMRSSYRDGARKVLARAQEVEPGDRPWALAYVYLLADGSRPDAYGASQAFVSEVEGTEDREPDAGEYVRIGAGAAFAHRIDAPSKAADARGWDRPTSVAKRPGRAARPKSQRKRLQMRVLALTVRRPHSRKVRTVTFHTSPLTGRWIDDASGLRVSTMWQQRLNQMYRVRHGR